MTGALSLLSLYGGKSRRLINLLGNGKNTSEHSTRLPSMDHFLWVKHVPIVLSGMGSQKQMKQSTVFLQPPRGLEMSSVPVLLGPSKARNGFNLCGRPSLASSDTPTSASLLICFKSLKFATIGCSASPSLFAIRSPTQRRRDLQIDILLTPLIRHGGSTSVLMTSFTLQISTF
ncbi:hypothetical protein HYPSUDRAFT_72581 [Hypholoma sublateritium FD-334 SS-4]|uniref:Uncharacterized protein n=1 Tax=Hypholoma sublateritium (strain FD-334 SS-4) TaxID=945553 RepID=A0A0D2P1D6_HYPSF|nr:hypothetical protein HYPSUDRAFT_72581 [Hypholoma sublateritium FD-334 SS-4]